MDSSLRNRMLVGLIFLFSNATAQNLVLNSSFEQFEICPQSYNTSFVKPVAKHWNSPSHGTPDYFNTCSSDIASVPENWAGVCEPSTGEGYIGFYFWQKNWYREHLQGTLSEPLQSGKKYLIRLHLSQAQNSEYLGRELQVLLSSSPQKSDNYFIGFLQKSALLTLPIDKTKLINQEWLLLEKSYVAKGGERYITIGDFGEIKKESPSKNLERLFEERMLDNSIYLFLDDIQVIPQSTDLDPKTDNSEHDKVHTFSLDDVNFDFNSSELSTQGLNYLDSILFIKDFNLFKVEIKGYTDDVGSRTYNYHLGMNRASSVAEYLAFKGVNERNINLSSYGEAQPIAPNTNAASRAKNRRVEIVLSKK